MFYDRLTTENRHFYFVLFSRLILRSLATAPLRHSATAKKRVDVEDEAKDGQNEYSNGKDRKTTKEDAER